MRYHFQFISNGFGVSDYSVYDRETKKECRISLSNDTPDAWRMFDPIPAEMLSAFNDWRKEKHESDVRYLLDRYGQDALEGIRPFVEARQRVKAA
jgi:hypothetical protein